MSKWVTSCRAFVSRPAIVFLLVTSLLLGGYLVVRQQSSVGTEYSGDLPETVKYNRDIRPILSDKCSACHGPDEEARKANLRLDVRESATAEREGYERPAIVPGEPNESELIHRIYSSDPDSMMPPPEMNKEGSGGKKLSAREKALLKKWIAQGAEYEKHWAYIPPTRPEPPEIKRQELVYNPIDRFVVKKLKEQDLKPVPVADRHTLIRRLSLDLRGLPPEPEEVDAFVNDDRPDAYERLVDRMLDSKHYGERMAVMWLDLVRYADTDGYHSDLHRNIYPFRDYVIQSFNENKPFDQFTREQIAGDLLPEPTREQLVASGFNRLNQATKEGGSQPKEFLMDYAIDRVRTVSNTWLASSMECAQCHDHKYDPYTMDDFYSMAAFFADIKEKGLFPNENELPPEMNLPDESEAETLETHREKLDRLETKKRRLIVKGKKVPDDLKNRIKNARKKVNETENKLQKTMVTKSIEPRVVRILPRGDWRKDSGEIVEPDVPDFLPDMNVNGRRADRLDLANWLVSRDNPLTARSFVNHLWDEFFGTGISKRLSDFGAQGHWPTHPELLDWLAVEFMESGWDVKHMVKLIVMSRTYRRSSIATKEHLQKDPNNRYIAHQSRFRLKAEFVRDTALAISGLLNREVGGPSVKPYQPDGYWSDIQTFDTPGPASEWNPSKGEDQYQRGLYTYWKRSFLHPTMKVFNAPSRQRCAADRVRSNTPLQALALLNDPSFVEAARVFAYRIMKNGGDAFEKKIHWAFKQALARSPKEKEIDVLSDLYDEQLKRYKDDPDAAKKLIQTGQHPVPDDVKPHKLAAWTSVTRSILNLHETITRY